MLDSPGIGRDEPGDVEVFTAIFCCGLNLEILSAPPASANKKSKFGLGRQAVCCGFLEAHNPKTPFFWAWTGCLWTNPMRQFLGHHLPKT